MHPRPGTDEIDKEPLGGEILEDLTRRRIDVERDTGMRLPSLDDLRRDGKVSEAGVRGRSDHDLRDLRAGNLPHRDHVAVYVLERVSDKDCFGEIEQRAVVFSI